VYIAGLEDIVEASSGKGHHQIGISKGRVIDV